MIGGCDTFSGSEATRIGYASMTTAGAFVPPLHSEQAWLALCEDAGANVVVCDREGTILYANRQAGHWLRWRDPARACAVGDNLFDDSVASDALREERRALCARVYDGGRGAVYESIYRSVRYRVTMRPVVADDARRAVLVVSRRMRPWERVGGGGGSGPEPVVVRHHDPGVFASLSVRELEVLVLIGEGLSYAEIAERLHRSVRTVERHRDRLGQKLGAHNRVQLARFAIRAGLSELPTPPEQAELEASGYDPLALTGPVRRIADRRARSSG